jgi:hypothetical protein
MVWEWRENNRKKVLQALRKGEYEAILTSREGALDALAHIASELDVFEAVELVAVERERDRIPDGLQLRTLAILPFVEAMSLCAAANTLFDDAAGAFTILPLEELVLLLGGKPPQFPFRSLAGAS